MSENSKTCAPRIEKLLQVIALAALLLLSTGAARAQEAPTAAESHDTLHLLVGRSLVINSPTRIRRLSIADPNIADALLINPTQILVNGKAPGGVSLVLWNESDQSQLFELFVDMDILGLSEKIHEEFPNEKVKVEASKDLVMVSGHASTKAIADKIMQVVMGVNPKVVNLMDSPGKPMTGEVLLEVKFAEVDRSALNQLGMNLFSIGGGKGAGNTVGSTTTGQFAPGQLSGGILPPTQTSSVSNSSTTTTTSAPTSIGSFTLSSILNIFVYRPDINLGLTIQALQQHNLLQILAEPNLLTMPGKEASFLAGGEFPFPVVQGGTAGSVPTVTIQFREFGVKLNFTPDITEEGRIHLKVKPEVSALDFSNAVNFAGFTIPALSTRKVDAEVELSDGQGFAIAGLVDDRVTSVISKVPLLGDLPVLGQFFKSKATSRSKTELLVLVTPHIVRPFDAGQAPPGPQFPKPFMEPARPETPRPATPESMKPGGQK